MRGDCSIRTEGIGFSAEEIADCAKRMGLLSIELELSASKVCACESCKLGEARDVLSVEEIGGLVEQAKELGCKRVILIDTEAGPCANLQQIVCDLKARELDMELFTDSAGIKPEFARFLHRNRVALGIEWNSVEKDSRDTGVPPVPSAQTVNTPALSGVGKAKDASGTESPSTLGTPCTGGTPVSRGSFLRAPLAVDADCQNQHGIVAAHLPALSHLCDAGYGSPAAPKLAVRIVAGAQNVDEIPLLWRQIRSCGFEPHLQVMTPRGVAGKAMTLLPPERSRRLFEELEQIDREEFGRVWPAPPSLVGRSCSRHQYACHVAPCGTIFACVGVTIPLGNIRTEPLSEIHGLSEVVENLRAFKEKVKEPCRTCCKTTDCYGCRGAAYQLTGDYLAGDQLCWKAASTPIQILPVDAAGLVPHGPSMRMVDRLVRVDERRARAEFTVPRDSLFVDAAGRLDTLAYIEMIAQAFAACHGFHLSADERAMHRGLLLGIKDLVISGEARVGDRLLIDIHKVTRFGDFGIVDGEIRHEDGRLLGAGQIKIWRPGDNSAKVMIP